MTREDINDIINAICPNDEDYEKPCISPKYLRQELEQLAVDQRQWNEDPTTKDNLGVVTPQEPKTKIEESNFSQEQYLADIQSAYDCGKSVIDKIRAEIESDWQLKKYPASPFSCGLRRAIEIIDKYNAESEG